jgi:hypothetical protein
MFLGIVRVFPLKALSLSPLATICLIIIFQGAKEQRSLCGYENFGLWQTLGERIGLKSNGEC